MRITLSTGRDEADCHISGIDTRPTNIVKAVFIVNIAN